ncbi:MAG: sigma-54 dependent transcriptional regulator [Gammaproteobacteria bacterium]|nr:sigma-54 dependent transcriptional regulator [Gammaproteobacteria bacterium]
MSETTVLIVEDNSSLRQALCDTLDLAGFTTIGASDAPTALSILEKSAAEIVISDVKMEPMDGHRLLNEIQRKHPEIPVLLMTAFGDIEQAVRAMQDGAVDYLVKPFEAGVLVDSVNRYVLRGTQPVGMLAADCTTKQLLKLANRVAVTDATVMITGESGTGKEVLARYIHDHSARAEGAFVAINCAAIPDTMLEATLFGYQKGAFTGAHQSCPGKFEQAQGGTLLLDEISEMDLALQAKLLRVLQEREVERLGSNKLIKLDVRVLATSNVDMSRVVSEGRFRTDLYYRLNVFPLHVPPLRERPKDILLLANHFLKRHANRCSLKVASFSPEAQQWLSAQRWEGNVRELENLLHRAVILTNGHEIGLEDLEIQSESDRPQMSETEQEVDSNGSLDKYLKAHEEDRIVETLQSVDGSREQAAKLLGISQRTLRYKLARLREQGVSIPSA